MRIFKTSLDNYYANDMKSNNNNNFNEIDSNKVPHCFGDFRNKTCDFRKLQVNDLLLKLHKKLQFLTRFNKRFTLIKIIFYTFNRN